MAGSDVTALNREAFWFVYANANSLAELGLREAGASLLESPPAVEPGTLLSEDELEAKMLAGFDNLDWSALDALNLDNEAPLDIEPASDQVAGMPEGEFSLEQYLQRAYDCEAPLSERLDDHYERVDLQFIEAVLSQLPAELPPLTRRLSAADMQEWLRIYGEGHAGLGDLIARIRQLDMMRE